MQIDKYVILKKWFEFYENDLNILGDLKTIDSDWENVQESFLTKPSIYNGFIEFSDEFGYSSFNLFTLSTICSIISSGLGMKKNVFVGMDKTLPNSWKEHLIKTFNFHGHKVLSNGFDENINEDIIRTVADSQNFDCSIFIMNEVDNLHGKIKLFKNNGKLVDKDVYTSIINSIFTYETVKLDEVMLSYDQTSLKKITSHLSEELVKIYVEKFPSYTQNLFIYGNFYDKLQYEIFTKVIRNLGFKFNNVSKNMLGRDLVKGAFNFLNILKITKKSPDLFFICDQRNMLEIYLKINGSLKKFGQDSIAFIFIDFMFSFWKKNNMLDRKVVLPPNASKKIITLLDNYHIKHIYENEYIAEENVLFNYSNFQFSSGIKNNLNLNNTSFIIMLVILLNNYKNKNDLLNYKYNQSLEIYSNYSKLTKSIKLDTSKINEVECTFPLNMNITKKDKIMEIINYNFRRDNIYYINGYITSSGINFIIYYNFLTNSLTIELEQKNNADRFRLTNFLIRHLVMRKIFLKLKLLRTKK
ncbi:MAG5620 family putative phospho-sugar mutase [Mycoplasma crocodyli]|uniref:Uncharacterized protein n=1 Tax=Mycoplasma crocodyli (strain ATCC 51981 / MP145) TaxID=512564 RepID=D5E4S5_MYCCM|nr:hypothetical protein [Mycoplasma crocodyli]ADE19976.1 hypothetical protein MCRO_0090 [Mycoplasma crocodyli MP145]